MNITLNIAGIKIGNKVLVSRKEACQVLGISRNTFRAKLCKGEIPKESRVETNSGEMFIASILFGIKVK